MEQREIKFRGISHQTGEWVFGFAYRSHRNQWWIYKDSANIAVIPETVGQFTGLHDKNGKEIFDGDILQWFENGHFLISQNKFEQHPVYGIVESVPGGWTRGGLDLRPLIVNDLEVAGSIYQNPELLDKEIKNKFSTSDAH